MIHTNAVITASTTMAGRHAIFTALRAFHT